MAATIVIELQRLAMSFCRISAGRVFLISLCQRSDQSSLDRPRLAWGKLLFVALPWVIFEKKPVLSNTKVAFGPFDRPFFQYRPEVRASVFLNKKSDGVIDESAAVALFG